MVNMLGAKVSGSMLNRYNLTAMSFKQIVYDEYFYEILFLRIRTVLGLWIVSKIFSKKWVMLGFACVMCSFMGAIMAMSIMENGLWGILFCVCAFFPHGICYGVAYVMWSNLCVASAMEREKKERYFVMTIIMLLIGIGSMLETYISPVLLQNIIKY